jgi:vacuolar-type H+-ATPase subunit F/Vma7
MNVMIIGDKYLTSLFRLVAIETIEVENEDSAVAEAEGIVERGKHE